MGCVSKWLIWLRGVGEPPGSEWDPPEGVSTWPLRLVSTSCQCYQKLLLGIPTVRGTGCFLCLEKLGSGRWVYEGSVMSEETRFRPRDQS